MQRKAYEIWCFGMSDGHGRYFLHQTLNEQKAKDWCSKQLGIMGTPAPNDHHWVKEVDITEAKHKKLVARELLLIKLIPILTDEEFKTLGIEFRF